VNLGIARLAIVLALVVGGVAVLANGFTDQDEAAAEPPADSPSPTPSPSPSPSKAPQQTVVPNQEGVLVQVLNGTAVPGLAADFQVLLEEENYIRAGDPTDAPNKPVVDSVVYFRRDGNAEQNRADAEFLSETYLGGVPVEPLPPAIAEVVEPAADVVVLLGEDQAGQV
jgi:LytR cell envelope-related transcriptional attenuator